MKLDLNRIEAPFVMELINETGNKCILDANPSLGGKGLGFRPMELLAGSLAACISIDVINVLKKQRTDPNHYSVRIEGHRKAGIPSPFEIIHMIFEVDSSVNRVKLERNIQLTIDKYCSVTASLKSEIKITFEISIAA